MPRTSAESREKNAPKGIPKGIWTKCAKCEQIIFQKELMENDKVCPKCGAYQRMNSQERIEQLLDAGSFVEMDGGVGPVDALSFPDYERRIVGGSAREAIVTGTGTLGGFPVALGVMNFEFMGGSMGSVVGEKIVRNIEAAISRRLPVIIVSSSGGARMQEGILSLMQMARTSAALNRLAAEGLPYISVLTDPTTGGVAASFSMLGDINVAEPNALIGFAGPRVIEQTIRQTLPAGFQSSEFVQDHGMVDLIVERNKLKDTLARILRFFAASPRRRG